MTKELKIDGLEGKFTKSEQDSNTLVLNYRASGVGVFEFPDKEYRLTPAFLGTDLEGEEHTIALSLGRPSEVAEVVNQVLGMILTTDQVNNVMDIIHRMFTVAAQNNADTVFDVLAKHSEEFMA